MEEANLKLIKMNHEFIKLNSDDIVIINKQVDNLKARVKALTAERAEIFYRLKELEKRSDKS